MGRIRLTQVFPCLLPLRKKQRIFCYYMGMHLDRNRYAKTHLAPALPHALFWTSWPLYSFKTGYEMLYQENKAYNCRLAAKELNGLVIAPGETFSFWNSVRHADRERSYREGYVLSDGELQLSPGGGLCQMSSFLFWLFQHTPLTVTEHHSHGRDLHLEAPGIPRGVDTAVAEGWLDLKVKNDTPYTFQLLVSVGGGRMSGAVLSDTVVGDLPQTPPDEVSAVS